METPPEQTGAAPPSPKQVMGVGLADLCIKRPVFATMINLLLVVLGWFAYQKIGIDQFPNVELPIITVTTTLRGASPEEVETSVSKPLEEVINTIEGVDELSSVSREGISRITVQFLYERNRDVAAQDVRDKVSSIVSQLPQGTDTPVIGKFDLDALPVISISVSAPRDRAVFIAILVVQSPNLGSATQGPFHSAREVAGMLDDSGSRMGATLKKLETLDLQSRSSF